MARWEVRVLNNVIHYNRAGHGTKAKLVGKQASGGT